MKHWPLDATAILSLEDPITVAFMLSRWPAPLADRIYVLRTNGEVKCSDQSGAPGCVTSRRGKIVAVKGLGGITWPAMPGIRRRGGFARAQVPQRKTVRANGKDLESARRLIDFLAKPKRCSPPLPGLSSLRPQNRTRRRRAGQLRVRHHVALHAATLSALCGWSARDLVMTAPTGPASLSLMTMKTRCKPLRNC